MSNHPPDHHDVRIHIDREPYKSPTPTTGHALYKLGGIHKDHVLFREVKGNKEDQEIPNDETEVRLKEDEHFYSAEVHMHEITIIVNGRKKKETVKKLSFEEIVALAFDPPPSGPNIVFTVTFRHGPRHHPEGSLSLGETIKIKDGMVFNVTATDKS